jgi:hypothetical protein
LIKKVAEAKMRFRVIACEILFREVSLCAAQSPHIVDLVFMPKGLHDEPKSMTAVLQEEIDKTDPERDEVVVLAYGLCSRGTVGLRAREVPLVVPRCHDCITMLLGSQEKYDQHFREHPGSYYFTAGWIERGGASPDNIPSQGFGMGRSLEDYLAAYGEDNGRFLFEFENSWQNKYDTAAYIRMPESDRPEVRETAERIAARNGWQVVELPGSSRFFEQICSGEWPEENFLIVPPGGEVAQAVDHTVLKVVVEP